MEGYEKQMGLGAWTRFVLLWLAMGKTLRKKIYNLTLDYYPFAPDRLPLPTDLSAYLSGCRYAE